MNLYFKYFLITILSIISIVLIAQKPIYLDLNRNIEERIEDALSRMTTEEKVAMCHAQSKFSSAGVPRLGIPENWMTDGPHGIRAEVLWDEWKQADWTNDSCIAFPALTCLAASWNTEMSAIYGNAIGEEARYRNKNVLLGPGVNIYRSPLNGRNFEYMGEDPYLASEMVVPYIKSVQKNGVAACVKHFAVNNQETYRHSVNVKVSDRALHEIYLPAFKTAVEVAGAWAIMGAYNKYNGEQCCHNQYLLNDILKRDWKFDGVVVSDWGGVYDTKLAISNGLDMEFGTWTDGLTMGASNAYQNYFLAQPYLRLIQNGEVGTKELDDKVRRILRLIFKTNMASERYFGSFGTNEHAMVAKKVAQEGIVLLKNDRQTLPIETKKINKIAVIGENATRKMTIGGGSSSLKAKYEVTPLEGILKRVGDSIQIQYARGYESYGERKDDPMGKININTTGKTADELIKEAVEVAQQADYVIFVGGLNKNKKQDAEGEDRESMDLPYSQNILIEALVKANPNIAVVLICGNAVTMPWVSKVPAVVYGWYAGSEAGNALASVLFGDVNPSGKLPFTIPVRLEDNSAHSVGEFPGTKEEVNYKEDIFVGYRWAEYKKIKPLFAFGHGLSYTSFEYSKLALNKKQIQKNDSIEISLKIKNTGTRAGSEIVQLYINDEKSTVVRPVKELKSFKKVYLNPGEEQSITFSIDKTALQFYNEKSQQWEVEDGNFKVFAGAASDDIRCSGSFKYVN